MTPEGGKGTLTPFIPLSLGAFKGEGEGKTEGYACALAQAYPSSLVLRGEGGTEAEVGAFAPASASSSILERGEGMG